MYNYEIWEVYPSGDRFIAGFNKGDPSRFDEPFDAKIAVKEFELYCEVHRPNRKGARRFMLKIFAE